MASKFANSSLDTVSHWKPYFFPICSFPCSELPAGAQQIPCDEPPLWADVTVGVQVLFPIYLSRPQPATNQQGWLAAGKLLNP